MQKSVTLFVSRSCKEAVSGGAQDGCQDGRRGGCQEVVKTAVRSPCQEAVKTAGKPPCQEAVRTVVKTALKAAVRRPSRRPMVQNIALVRTRVHGISEPCFPLENFPMQNYLAQCKTQCKTSAKLQCKSHLSCGSVLRRRVAR